MYTPREINHRMKAPKTDGVTLWKDERPIDYGHCLEIMQEKYGPARGQRMYDALVDSNKTGIQFVIATKIMKEKQAMIQVVGADHGTSYQQLWDRWMARGRMV